MDSFTAKTICILGRQPALGLAELESLYGAEHVQPAGGHATLDFPAEEINFQRLGGVIKVARVLAELNDTAWRPLADYLIKMTPEQAVALPAGKLTLGLSAYGIKVSAQEISAALLKIKKRTRRTGRPVRIVPNSSPMLNSAQVLHNKLTHKGSWELLLVKNDSKTIIAQTLFVQDIEAYGARDQARPARDARVGMLPPKLAQIIVNLAAGPIERRANGQKSRIRVLDPFCGTGVILQEALLMGFSVYGTDIDPRMVEFTKTNLQWLIRKQPKIEGHVTVEAADASSYRWPGFSCVASEVYLGRPLSTLPPPEKLQPIIMDTNQIIKKFLKNLAQRLKPGQLACLALPAWRQPDGSLIQLPVLDKLTDMGYTQVNFKHINNTELVYFRESQVVARKLLVLKRTEETGHRA